MNSHVRYTGAEITPAIERAASRLAAQDRAADRRA